MLRPHLNTLKKFINIFTMKLDGFSHLDAIIDLNLTLESTKVLGWEKKDPKYTYKMIELQVLYLTKTYENNTVSVEKPRH